MHPGLLGAALLPLLTIQAPLPPSVLIPAASQADLARDSRDGEAVLLGVCSREALLAHREIFRVNTGKAVIPAEWKVRWKAIDTPCTVVVAVGSWCGDSQREVPDLLALMAEPNPFITVHFLGVWRDKRAREDWWPRGIEAQKIEKVPTFWLFTQQPGAGQMLSGLIVENPPRKGQRMAEAILELLEKGAR